jgi:hypothetical protein
MGDKWRKYMDITESPKVFLPTLVIFWIIMLFLLHQAWMDKSKIFGIVGAAIGGGIMAPII